MAEADRQSDEQLIACANSGDAEAFEALYARYRDWVVGLAYRFTRNRDDALDVLQETFIYFFGKFPGFELTAQLKTFLYPAVKNLSIRRRRKAGRFTGLGDAEEAIPAKPSENAEAARSELAALLESLPEGEREVLLLRFVDGLKLEEISQALEIPLGTVKSRLHNALGRLRDDPGTRKYFEP